ncbi:hypothetical protein [Undibacterium sp.]|uniref:hypothetical protein n=1 Tax=Undibacterium sp. TaxID=1914977 RepID=UPI00374D4568
MKHLLHATIIGSLLVFSSLAQAQSSNNANEANTGKQPDSATSTNKASSAPAPAPAAAAKHSKRVGKKKPANNTNCPTDTTKQSGSPDYSGCKQNPEYK